jgi:flagellar hook-basal body complex protein FliE
MTIAEISAVAGMVPLQAVQRAEIGATEQSFAALLARSVESVNGALVGADTLLAQAALDGSQPPHQVMLALEEARLSFQLALQIRNRLLEGYQELMRMQV